MDREWARENDAQPWFQSARADLVMSLLTCAFLFLPFRSWQLLSWHTLCSGPLAWSSIQLSPAAMSPALTPSSLSTVPMSKLPEILPGMVKLRCCPRRLREQPGCSRGAILLPHLSDDELHSYVRRMMWRTHLNDHLVDPAAGPEYVEWCMGTYKGYETQRDRRVACPKC